MVHLPISGHFVDMLRRVVQLSRAVTGGGEAGSGILPPWRLLDANAALLPASGDAKPLDLTGGSVVRQAGPDNPPGLYGGEDGFVALNLFGTGETLAPIAIPEFEVAGDPFARSPATARLISSPGCFRCRADRPAGRYSYRSGAQWRLPSPWFKPATLLRQPSCDIAHHRPVGRADSPPRRQFMPRMPSQAMSIFLRVSTGPGLPMSSPVMMRPTVSANLGLDSLSRYLFSRTALEPGTAMGVDIETDQLALYPLIYWPMSEDADMPSPAAISRIDAYMKSGGTVLFDTRDRIVDLGGGSSALTLRLQQILANLDIPPLEPVPADHVLTKSFFLLDNFPGRYSDGPLWVEAIRQTRQPRSSGRCAPATASHRS
jgi:hypothetical protein